MAQHRMTVQTPTTASTVEGDATPSSSEDGTARVVWGCDDVGRGVLVTIQPLEANGQFVLHRVELTGTPSNAGPEDA
jgi:hypothetical protein